MGFPKNLFVEKVEEDYCCKICQDVVENPLQCSHCESLFCYDCIEKLIRTLNKCPNCIKIIQTQKVARLVKNAINRLAINCRNGCGKQITLEHIQYHEYDECESKQMHRECKQRIYALQKEHKGLQDQFKTIKTEIEKTRNENASLKEMNFNLKYQIDVSKIINQQDKVNDQVNPEK